MNEFETRLDKRGIKPTAMRLLILKAMLGFGRAFSLHDLEDVLDTVDKSTIFRTITLFHEKQLVHSIDDGSGSMKYSLCSNSCSCSLGDMHLHFHCIHCGNTFCLENISIPEITLPDNFLLQSVNFVLKGYCAGCSKFAT